MKSLPNRIERIEEQLEPDKGACLRWPNGDGTFIEVPGCRDLNDPRIVIGITRETDTSGIRRNPTA
jgi:hypothetical protein